MNMIARIIAFIISFIPGRSFPQEHPSAKVDRYYVRRSREAKTDVELFDIQDVDETQAQIEEIKKQIEILRDRLNEAEIRNNPLRQMAYEGREFLRRSTKD